MTTGLLNGSGSGQFEYDGANQLIRTQSTSTSDPTRYAYDAMGRRFAKVTYPNAGGAATAATLFIYDGWNLIAEYKLDSEAWSLDRTYTWGIDLSGTTQRAGGVGGLLAVTKFPLPVGEGQGEGVAYYAIYDGNGNIEAYLDSNGQPAAIYQYDAFGNVLIGDGRGADFDQSKFSHRFSTKYQDAETGLLYYGYRYYQSRLGRWVNRDPIEEEGGLNLSEFVGNDSVQFVDAFGLSPQVWTFSGIHSYNKNYGENDHFEPYVDSKLRGLEYPERDVVKNVPPAWPGFKGAHVNFVSRAGIKLGYAWPFDKRDHMLPLTEHTLDREAKRLAKWVERGAFCGGRKKTKIKAILFAPKTDTLPDQGCCDIEFVVYWSEKDNVMNQGPGNALFTSRESQGYWSRWGGKQTYNINHGINGGLFTGQHGLDGFIDGLADDLIEGQNPFEPEINKAPHPMRDYVRPWYRGDHEKDVDYIFIGHSQGTNIMMHLLQRACCIGGQK